MKPFNIGPDWPTSLRLGSKLHLLQPTLQLMVRVRWMMLVVLVVLVVELDPSFQDECGHAEG